MASTERKDEIEIGDLVSVTVGAYEYDAFILTVIPNQNLGYEVHFAGYSREFDGLVSKESVKKYGENAPLRREGPDKPPPEAPIRTRPQLSPDSKVSRKRPGSPAPRKPKRRRSKKRSIKRLLQLEASRLEVRLPDLLVLWLSVDEDHICQKHKVIELPARVDVDSFLSKYIDYRESNGFSSEEEHKDVLGMVFSVKGYFIKYLPRFLYPLERPKYEEITKTIPCSSYVCKLYSVMHLLRMIGFDTFVISTCGPSVILLKTRWCLFCLFRIGSKTAGPIDLKFGRMHWVLEQEEIDVNEMESFFVQLTNLTSIMEQNEEKLFDKEDYIAPPRGSSEEESSEEESSEEESSD